MLPPMDRCSNGWPGSTCEKKATNGQVLQRMAREHLEKKGGNPMEGAGQPYDASKS
jgi:hypothetical protein